MTDSLPSSHDGRASLHDERQDDELDALRAEMQEHRDHRTAMRTLTGLAGAAMALVIVGAVNVRDTTLATSARVDALTARVQAIEIAAHARDTDDRGTRESLVRLTTTIDAMRAELTDVRAAVLPRGHSNAPSGR